MGYIEGECDGLLRGEWKYHIDDENFIKKETPRQYINKLQSGTELPLNNFLSLYFPSLVQNARETILEMKEEGIILLDEHNIITKI